MVLGAGFEPANAAISERCLKPLDYPRWGGRRDSNSQPTRSQPVALPLSYVQHMERQRRIELRFTDWKSVVIAVIRLALGSRP